MAEDGQEQRQGSAAHASQQRQRFHPVTEMVGNNVWEMPGAEGVHRDDAEINSESASVP